MSLIASTWSINSLCTSASDTINITVPLGMRWSPASDFRSLGAVGLNFITFHPPMGHTLLVYSNSSLAGYHPLFRSNFSSESPLFLANKKCIYICWYLYWILYNVQYIIYVFLHSTMPSWISRTTSECQCSPVHRGGTVYIPSLTPYSRCHDNPCIHTGVSDSGTLRKFRKLQFIKSYPFRSSQRSFTHKAGWYTVTSMLKGNPSIWGFLSVNICTATISLLSHKTPCSHGSHHGHRMVAIVLA